MRVLWQVPRGRPQVGPSRARAMRGRLGVNAVKEPPRLCQIASLWDSHVGLWWWVQRVVATHHSRGEKGCER